MIACKHCQTLNSLDSAFCRKCGTSLPEDELKDAQEKLDALVLEGTHAFNEGRIDEAVAVAETAVISNPNSVNALALKGMCHERRGEVAEALEAYEKVVSLNPDSALDKIKLNQLRNLLVARTQPAAQPDRRVAAIAAIAATVLVVCLGTLGAMMLNRPTNEVVAQAGLGQAQYTPDAPIAAPQNSTPEPAAPVNQGSASLTDVQPIRQGDPAATGTGLPALPPDMQIRPLQPQGPIGTLPAPEGNGHSIRPENPAPRQTENRTPPQPTGPDPDPTTSVAPPDGPVQGDGVIEITVSNPNPPLPGGGVDVSNPNGVEALLRAARNQFETGNFGGAANSYERALRMGADTGLINQRLGMTYERLGRREDAIAAYTRAVQALEAAVAKGQTNKQRALDSSRAALGALRG